MKVLLVANLDWNLFNFRLPLAHGLRCSGHEVILVCPHGEYVPKLQEAGYRVVHWGLSRRNLNPLGEFLAVVRLALIYRHERPDMVHHFTVKPNIYGTLAARIVGVPLVINTWTGLGFAFRKTSLAGALRLGLALGMRRLFKAKNVITIFQNPDDLNTMEAAGLVKSERAIVIPGSGVNTAVFKPGERTSSPELVVLMAARLLWEKGVHEFMEAARLLKERGVYARFQIAGAPDVGNPDSLSHADVDRLRLNSSVDFLGQRNDMPQLLEEAAVAVLPTYYNEGLPRFLLEAAASGLPIVATHIAGCRMVVREGVNGFLVPIRDAKALADAIERLLEEPALRERMGRASREIAVQEFDERLIVRQYLDLYHQLGVLPVPPVSTTEGPHP